jgi:hypothetical protein
VHKLFSGCRGLRDCVQIGKWTKLGPAIDIVMGGSLVCGIYGSVFNNAFECGKADSMSETMGLPQDAEVEYIESVDWQKLRSKRATITTTFLNNRESQARMVVLAIAIEPVRALLRFVKWLLPVVIEYAPFTHLKSYNVAYSIHGLKTC